MDLEVVSATCANVSALSVTVRNLAPSADVFDSYLCALEATAG